MSLRSNIYWALAVLFLFSCANQTSPTGGPRDETAPELINSSPSDKSVNFKDQTIVLEFDEYLKLKNPKEEIIITPRISGNYEIKLKKTKVTIELEDSLESNTTYTFNFRESIQDLNEGNIPENLQLAFSTGDYLDSLIISGSTYHLLNNKKAKDITIALYDAEDTLDVFNSSPVYFTKSNDEGEYTFNNLKNGKYKVYAIHDTNKNLQLETKNESYSYLDQPIQLDSNFTDLSLPLINLDITPLTLQSARLAGQYYIAKYNKYVEKYKVRSLDSTKNTLSSILTNNNREVKFYNNNSIVDTLGLIVTAYDTLLDHITDTIYVKYQDSKRKKDEFNISYSPIIVNKEDPLIKVEISYTKPNLYINYDSIYYQVDSLNKLFPDSSHFTWNANYTKLKIEFPLDKKIFEKPVVEKNTSDKKENDSISVAKFKQNLKNNRDSLSKARPINKTKKSNENNKLHFKQEAFISLESDTSILHAQNISFLNRQSLGILLLEVNTKEENYILQLLDNKNKVVLQYSNEKKLTIENIKPGTYRLRILVDSNNNGIWDIGNITKNTLSEPVFFYKNDEDVEEITLRANWELGPLMIEF